MRISVSTSFETLPPLTFTLRLRNYIKKNKYFQKTLTNLLNHFWHELTNHKDYASRPPRFAAGRETIVRPGGKSAPFQTRISLFNTRLRNNGPAAGPYSKVNKNRLKCFSQEHEKLRKNVALRTGRYRGFSATKKCLYRFSFILFLTRTSKHELMTFRNKTLL